MDDREKTVAYEVHIEDMLNVLFERLAEFTGKEDLCAFEQGRQLAYIEMMDIIKTRHKMILEVLGDPEETSLS